MGNFSKAQVLELNVLSGKLIISGDTLAYLCYADFHAKQTHLQKIQPSTCSMMLDFKLSAYPELISLKDKFDLRAETIICKKRNNASERFFILWVQNIEELIF